MLNDLRKQTYCSYHVLAQCRLPTQVWLMIIDSSGLWKYQYKLAIKEAERNANQAFNDELFEYFSAKDDDAF